MRYQKISRRDHFRIKRDLKRQTRRICVILEFRDRRIS